MQARTAISSLRPAFVEGGLVNTGGDSKASSSEALKIFMRGMGNDLTEKNRQR
jgi:hypothetical protein